MITYALLLARKHGQPEAYPLLVSYGDPLALTRRYEEVTGSGCADFAAENAELLFVADGAVLAHHDFPDPSEVKLASARRALDEARQVQVEHAKALANLQEAKDRASAAASQIKTLTPEQKQLLAEDGERTRKSDSEQAEAERRRLEKESAARELQERQAAANDARAAAVAARATFASEMAALSDEQLTDAVRAQKIVVPDEAAREELIAALADAAGIAPAEPAADPTTV